MKATIFFLTLNLTHWVL